MDQNEIKQKMDRTLMKGQNILEEFIDTIRKSINCKEVLESNNNRYNLRKYKITEIPEQNVIPMYQHIVEKFYKDHNHGQSGTWVENQLRLFLWILICYMEYHRKSYTLLDQEDWNFFSEVFYVKEQILFQYQTRILLEQSAKIAKWTDDQDLMLYSIITKNRKAKWTQIAKTLFINSNKKYLRASKQCRQRWLNHLDPSKTKSQWSLKQYLILFEHVEQKGKRWALLVKILNDRRSQHSIKNKYNSLIRKQSRLTPELEQKLMREQLIKRLNRIINTRHIDKNDEHLFGCSLKNINFQINIKNYDINKKITRTTTQDMQGYKNKFESFRIKIQKFTCEYPIKPTFYHHYQFSNKQNKQLKKQKYIKQQPTMQYPTTQQKSQPTKKPTTIQQKIQDQIFYQDSFQVHDLLRPQYTNALFGEDLKNFIREQQLDV